MNPIYFGTSEKPLFGTYYLPQAHSTKATGIVLCYPMGQEYMWMHRAYRQLATLFTRTGFHVLRFDYYRCVDSGGNSDEGDIAQWLDDVSTAIEEMKDSSGVTLPAPEESRPEVESAYVAPENEVERTIAGIWQEVLDVKKVGGDDNFFDLGGHSLLFVQVQSRLATAFNRDLSIIELFIYPIRKSAG